MYLQFIGDMVTSGDAYLPSAKSNIKSLETQFRRWANAHLGIAGSPTSKMTNPITSPGDLQKMTGLVRPIVGKQFGDVEKHPSGPFGGDDFDKMKLPLKQDKVSFPDPKMNKMYNDDAAARKAEMEAPAMDAAKWKFGQDGQEVIHDAFAYILQKMFDTTGIDGWQDSEYLRKTWAKLYAMQFMKKKMQSDSRSKAMGQRTDDEVDVLDTKATADVSGARTDTVGGTKARLTTGEKQDIRGRVAGTEVNTEGMPEADAELFRQIADIAARKSANPRMRLSDEDKEALEMLDDLRDEYPQVSQWVTSIAHG